MIKNFFKRLNVKKQKQANELERATFSKQWNYLCGLWANEKLPSPYQELFTYDAAIQGEGHFLFFENNQSNLQAIMSVLISALPQNLKQNLEAAYSKYLKNLDDLFVHDEFYYQNEKSLLMILEEYAKTIKNV